MLDLSCPRPIVHIGYHKTATTWFQNHVWPNIKSHDFIPRHTAQKALLAPPGMHFDIDQARMVLETGARQRPVIISEENFSGYIHNGGMHGLIGPETARRIHALLPNAQIVVFIRNQVDIVRASYCQYVSGGGTYSLSRYLDTHGSARGALNRPYKVPAFEWEHFEFDRLIAFYDLLFGPENVHVYPYEELAQPADLLRKMGRDLSIEFPADLKMAQGVNRSLSAMALRVLRFVNLFTRQSVANKRCIIDLPGGQGLRHAAKWLLKGVGSQPFQLNRSLCEQITQRYAASNTRLNETRHLRLQDLGYPVASERLDDYLRSPLDRAGPVTEAHEPTRLTA